MNEVFVAVRDYSTCAAFHNLYIIGVFSTIEKVDECLKKWWDDERKRISGIIYYGIKTDENRPGQYRYRIINDDDDIIDFYFVKKTIDELNYMQ